MIAWGDSSIDGKERGEKVLIGHEFVQFVIKGKKSFYNSRFLYSRRQFFTAFFFKRCMFGQALPMKWW